MDWTEEQESAINEEGQNIIVSAGAGSGKTAVLSERVIRKLKQGINIKNLLILTFTNAAAGEMKDRIRKKIKKEENLKEQLDYLDEAYITTFDSFALSLIKKYNYILNIPKNIKPIDSLIITIKKREILENILEDLYKEKNPKFTNLINNFCTKNDDEIAKSIIKIYDELDKKTNKKEYLNTYLNTYYNEETIKKNINEYTNNLIEIEQEIESLLEIMQTETDEKYYQKLTDTLSPISNSKRYNDLIKINEISLPRVSKETTEEGKTIKTKISDNIKKLQKSLKYKDEEEIKQGIEQTKDHVSIIIEILNKLDDQITKYKNENYAYEFNDIAKMAINLVKENKVIKEEIKNTYNEILVDEYQDTSDLQEEFLKEIENNNLYMVGDIKQSIYRFRNANPSIFKEKYEKYSKNINGLKIDLVKNFRSRKEVLNNINEIFNLIMDKTIGGADYQKEHQMVFGNSVYENEGKTNQNNNLEIYNYQEDKNYTKEEIEAFIIANDIKTKINNKYQILKDKKLQNITYNDFCIIMDRGSAFDTYKKIFEYMQIPLSIMQDEVLTTKEDILVLKNIISLIIKIKENKLDKEAEYYFTSISRSFLIEETDKNIFEILKNDKIKETNLYKTLKEISQDLDKTSTIEIIDKILKNLNYYENLIKLGNIEASIIRIEKIKELANALKDLNYTITDTKNYLEKVIEENQEIKYSLNTSSSNSVQLMNIHKSKGLEFSICYFSGMHKPFNKQDIKERFIYDNKYGIITPYFSEGIGETILKDLTKQKYLEEDISERIRLFYVDVTRAKEKMIIVTTLEKETEYQTNIVEDKIRKSYTSFQDILNSIKQNLTKYIKEVDLEKIPLSKDYITKIKTNKKINKTDKIINKKQIKIENSLIEEKKASKSIKKLLTQEEIKNMEYGTKMHELFETTDFKLPKNQAVKSLVEKLNIKDEKIYKEHEFILTENEEEYHGIIDLLIEYKDHIKIIDYKLQNTKDEAYLNQLETYKKYVNQISNKKVKLYLYSILNNELIEITK